MKLVCPYCNFTKDVGPANIPAGARHVTCPQCKQKFDLELKEAGQAQGPPPIEGAMAFPGSPSVSRAEPAFRPGPGYGGGSGIPWEDRPGGFFSDLWATSRGVLFSPNDFFARLAGYRFAGVKGPLSFGVMTGALGLIFGLFWQIIFTLIGTYLGVEADQGAPMTIIVTIMVVLMILSPLIVALGLLFLAAIQHLLLMIVRGAGGGFATTFRVLAYAEVTQVLNIIPVLGGVVGTVWAVVLVIIGLSRAHGISTLRSVMAVLVIPMIAAILFIVGLIVLALMVFG